MENGNWVEYKKESREKLRLFTLKVLDLSEKLPQSTRAKVINYQLTKSGSSMYVTTGRLYGRVPKRNFSAKCLL